VADGDEPAFAELYDATCRSVFGIVLRVLRDSSQAQEVTQEVYLDVWRTATRFDASRGTTTAWMNAIAHRRAVDRVRHSERTRHRDHQHAEAVTEVVDADPAELVVTKLEDTQRVNAALAQLPDVQRTALVLAYFDGYTQREISDLLAIPLGTVKTRTRDGLARLRLLLPVRA